jgi:hypothetical protein
MEMDKTYLLLAFLPATFLYYPVTMGVPAGNDDTIIQLGQRAWTKKGIYQQHLFLGKARRYFFGGPVVP